MIASPPEGRRSRKTVLFFLVILASFILIVQSSLAKSIFESSRERRVSVLRRLASGSTDVRFADGQGIREALLLDPDSLGYVRRELPDHLVDLFAEDDDDATSPTDPEETTIIDADNPLHRWHMKLVRKSPPMGGPVVADPMPKRPQYDSKTEMHLTWDYLGEEKLPPYVGNQKWMDKFPKNSRQWLNSLAVFPYAQNEEPELRYHGLLGVYPNGTRLWRGSPMPPPIDKVNRTEAMLDGGFYKDLADALPLDRVPYDSREPVCKSVRYNYGEEGFEPQDDVLDDDVSVVITVYNEPMSTLLRTLHSVLNNTPPSLIREIIVVDDHSDLDELVPGTRGNGTDAGGDIYEYVKLLPKTKLLRLGERRGLVWARLAGAQAAKAPILVVLDSHIEVNVGWLEPQLLRLKQSPKSIVFPQILGLEADTFTYNSHSGIGCWLSWGWSIVEQATLTLKAEKPDAIASASMAGGLFAVRLDWFWQIGGYDEEFSMWGAENVEMGFRTWMCGGRMECTPCARTYHIYRTGGVGYSSPGEMVWKNKFRTARIWMDEWYQVAEKFLPEDEAYIGNVDHMLELKQRLNCKSFKWFLDNVDPNHEGRDMDQIHVLGPISSIARPKFCLDSMGRKTGEPFGIFACHGGGGSQGVFKDRRSRLLREFADERTCFGTNTTHPIHVDCSDPMADIWSIDESTGLMKAEWKSGLTKTVACLTAVKDVLSFEPCDLSNENQKWKFTPFSRDPNFQPVDFSGEYKQLHEAIVARADV